MVERLGALINGFRAFGQLNVLCSIKCVPRSHFNGIRQPVSFSGSVDHPYLSSHRDQFTGGPFTQRHLFFRDRHAQRACAYLLAAYLAKLPPAAAQFKNLHAGPDADLYVVFLT